MKTIRDLRNNKKALKKLQHIFDELSDLKMSASKPDISNGSDACALDPKEINKIMNHINDVTYKLTEIIHGEEFQLITEEGKMSDPLNDVSVYLPTGKTLDMNKFDSVRTAFNC